MNAPDEVPPASRPLMSRFRDAFYGRNRDAEGTSASVLSNIGQIEIFGAVVEKPVFESSQRQEHERDDLLPAEKPWELREGL
jgi:hypothetical protein